MIASKKTPVNNSLHSKSYIWWSSKTISGAALFNKVAYVGINMPVEKEKFHLGKYKFQFGFSGGQGHVGIYIYIYIYKYVGGFTNLCSQCLCRSGFFSLVKKNFVFAQHTKEAFLQAWA